jgi:hypothetical protein
MRRLILQMGVSIDGFVAAPDGSHPWGYEREDPATKRWKLESVQAAGAHLMGRVTYQDMAAFWPTSTSEYAAPMNEIPKVVFSRTLEDAGLGRDARGACLHDRRRDPRLPAEDVRRDDDGRGLIGHKAKMTPRPTSAYGPRPPAVTTGHRPLSWW